MAEADPKGDWSCFEHGARIPPSAAPQSARRWPLRVDPSPLPAWSHANACARPAASSLEFGSPLNALGAQIDPARDRNKTFCTGDRSTERFLRCASRGLCAQPSSARCASSWALVKPFAKASLPRASIVSDRRSHAAPRSRSYCCTDMITPIARPLLVTRTGAL